MDSPRSDTPVSSASSQLDDHRYQEQSLPRSNTMSHSRTPTFEASPRPLLNVAIHGLGPIISANTHNESAISDGEDDNDDIVHTHHHGVDGAAEVITPHRPSAHDENTLAGPLRPSAGEYSGRARALSRKNPLYNVHDDSRSVSPPNSVDAFASPIIQRRHERSGTVGTQASGDLNLNHRLTMTSADADGDEECSNSDRGTNIEKVEEDVCFPMPEESESRRPGGFDLEEVDDFILSQLQSCDKYRPRRRKLSTTEFSPFHRSNGTGRARSPRRKGSRMPSMPGDNQIEVSLATTLVPTPEVQNEKMDTISIAGSIAPPDRFSFFGSGMDATIHAPEIGDLLMDGQTFRQLLQPYDEDPDSPTSTWWLDCLNPTDTEMKVIAKAFGIHPLTAEDIRLQEMREKVELFKHYYFVSFRSFVQNKKSEEYMEPINVYIIVFREGVISFQHADRGDETHHASNVRRRIRQLRDYVNLSPDWICYALIDDIVDTYGPTIEECEVETEAIEDGIFTVRPDDSQGTLERIAKCRRNIMVLNRLLGGKADVIKGFAKRCNEQYSVAPRGDIGLYLGDIQDHIVTMMMNLTHFEKILARSHGNYLASLSVDSIQANSRAADSLNKITVVATIIVPLNLICGLFGMNVNVPGKNADGLGWFFGIVGVIVLIVAICIWIAKRMRLF